MMKRVWALALALMLLALPVCGSAVTLEEKFSRQLEEGSGLKGTIVLDASGEADWLQALAPFAGVELQLKAISGDGQTEATLFLQDGEAEKRLLRLYSDGTTAGVTGDALQGSVILLPAGVQSAGVLAGDGARPSWLPLALGLLAAPEEDKASLDAAMQPLYDKIELWLADYASAPELAEDDRGGTLLRIRYEIAPAALKAEMLEVLKDISGSEMVMAALRKADASADAYFGRSALDAAPQVLDALELNGPAVLERTLTAMGETVLSKVTLPLAGGTWDTLELALGSDGTSSLALRGDGAAFSLTVDEHAALGMTETWKGTLTREGKDGPQANLTYVLTREKSSSVDEDARAHELTVWKLAFEAGEGSEVPSGEAGLTLHYHSKNGPSRPTTLQVFVTLDVPDAHVGLDVTLKTSTRWPIEPFELAGESWMAMTAERRGEVLGQLLAGLISGMAGATTIPVPEEIADGDAATPTDATPTDATPGDLR